MTRADPKPWYLSRAVWGGIVAAAAGIGAVAGIDIDQPALVELLLAAGGIAGGALGIYGRLRAERPIRLRAESNG